MSAWTNDRGRMLLAFPDSPLERVLLEDPAWTATDEPASATIEADPRLKQSRQELDELARTAGVKEPESLRTKADVLDAIDAAASGADPSGGSNDG